MGIVANLIVIRTRLKAVFVAGMKTRTVVLRYENDKNNYNLHQQQ